MKKAVFYLMTKKGLFVLEHFINEFGAASISAVVSEPDKNIPEDYFNKIKALCKKNRISFRRKNESITIKNSYSFAIGWKWMIKDKSQLFVFHDSLLPELRGFAPVVSALIEGKKYLGVSCIVPSDEYDKGDIVDNLKTRIRYPLKISEAIDICSLMYWKIINKLWKRLNKGKKLKPRKQNETRASYSLWRDSEDYHINWNWDSQKIKRFIDATGFPYSGAFSWANDLPVRILDSEIFPDIRISNRDPGKVIFIKNGFPVIVCGKGLLKLTSCFSDKTRKSIFPLRKFRTRFK